MDHDWLLRTGVEKVQAEVATLRERFTFDDELPSGARENLSQLCQTVWQLAHLIQLKSTSSSVAPPPTLSVYSSHSRLIEQAPPPAPPTPPVVKAPRKTLAIPFDMSSQKQYASICALTETQKPQVLIKHVYIDNGTLFVDAVFAGLAPSLAARYAKLSDGDECLPVASDSNPLPSDWLVPHPTEKDKFARFRFTGYDSASYGAKPYCGQLLDVVDVESKETRAAQLHEPIDDDQGEFDVLPPLRLTIKLNHGAVIKQGSDKRNKLLKRVHHLVGLASPVKTPVLFTLSDERSYGEGFVECDLDFVESTDYTCPSISLGTILGQMLDSKRDMLGLHQTEQLLATTNANFPGLAKIRTWPGDVNGRIELYGSCASSRTFKVDRAKSLLSMQFDTDEDSDDFVKFANSLKADYEQANDDLCSPIYEGALVLAHDDRFGDDVFRGLVTYVNERHIDVAHLDYYSNVKINHGEYRIAPKSSQAYTRPPRVIFVQMDMSKEQLKDKLTECWNAEDEQSWMTIEIEPSEHGSFLYHRGTVVEQQVVEEESQYVTVDEYQGPELESTKLEHEPGEHGDTVEVVVLDTKPLYWTREELDQMATKPEVITGTVTGVIGPLFIVTVDSEPTLATKQLLINPFHEAKYEIHPDMYTEVEQTGREMTAKVTNWQFTVTWSRKPARQYTSLPINAAAIVTAKAMPACPGHNVNYLELAIMDSFYEDDAEVIKAWKNYAAAFGITAFYHSPDDPLPHAEIKGAVLLGGKLTTELISYQTERNMTKFVLVDLETYKSETEWPWQYEGDEKDLIIDVYQHSGRFVLFKDKDTIKRGFIDLFSQMTNVRCFDDGLEYVVEPDHVYVYPPSCSKRVATFVTHLKYQFPTHGHELKLSFELNDNGDAEIAYKLIGRDAETGYPIVDLIQIAKDEKILKIDEMMNVSSEAESGRDYDLITEQEAQLYQRENTEKEHKEQCVDSDVDNNSSLLVTDEPAKAAAAVKPVNHVTMSVKGIDMTSTVGLFRVLLLPKKSSSKSPWAKKHMEHLKHYKTITAGDLQEPIDTTANLTGRDLVHKEGDIWRRCRYIKTTDLGIHCAYIDDCPIRMVNQEELVVPLHAIEAKNLMVITIAPFPSVKRTIYDMTLGDQLDPSIAAKLGELLRLRQVGDVSLDVRLDPDDFDAAVDAAVPTDISVKDVATQITTNLADYLENI